MYSTCGGPAARARGPHFVVVTCDRSPQNIAFRLSFGQESAMQPLADFPLVDRARIKAVLTDIDDTLTTAGVLTAEAYMALERLQRACIRVIPVTGRPAGWCDHIARMWPVDAVVGENGAFYFRYEHGKRTMLRRFAQPERKETTP